MPTLRERLQSEDEESPSEQLASTQAVAPADTSDEEEGEQQQSFSAEELMGQLEENGEQEQQQSFSPEELEAQLPSEQEQEQDVPINDTVVQNVAEQETGGVPEAQRDTVRGGIGEVGRTQVRPSTAVKPGFGVEPLAQSEEEAEKKLEDKETNLNFTRRYLKGLKQELGSTRDALIAFNWGPGKTREWIENGRKQSEIPDEVQSYVDNTFPKAAKAAKNLEEGGVPVDELDLQSELNQQQPPEDRVGQSDGFPGADLAEDAYRAGYNYVTEFITSAAEGVANRGAAQAIEATGGGLEFVERSIDKIGEEIVDFAEVSFTPQGVETGERAEFEGSYADEALDLVFENAAELTLDYASTFEQEPSQVDITDSPWSYLKAENLGAVVGEQGPLALGMIGGVLANPIAGTAAIGAIEGGDYLRRLDRLEKINPDKQLSEGEKLIGAAGVGAVNMALERTGINRILKAARVPGLKSKIFQTIVSGGTEKITETGQELSQILAEDYQVDELSASQVASLNQITERDMERLTKAAYGGAVIGTGLGATGATVESLIQKRRPDADLVDVEFDEEGRPSPVFRPRAHTSLEGRVSLQELEDQDLKVPEYRAAMLREDWRQSLNESLDDSRFDSEEAKQERVDAAVEAAMVLEDLKAAAKGVELETYLEENKVSPHRGGIITEDLLDQFAGKKADWGMTERRALERAKELDEQGFDRETIRETTGWFRNPNDDKWRMEIPAETMDFKLDEIVSPGGFTEGETQVDGVTMEEFVDTDHQIFELYPELKNVGILIDNTSPGGQFNMNSENPEQVGTITLSTRKSPKRTFWHELQHAIQFIEGFARGANDKDRTLLRERSSEAASILDEIDSIRGERNELIGSVDEGENLQRVAELLEREHELKEQLAEIFDKESVPEATRESYRNVAGEIEARVAASRNDARRRFEGEEPVVGSPVADIESETVEGIPTITRFYDNPVRSRLDAESKSPLLQDNESERSPAGAFDQTRDGRTLIQLFENADESTLPHEISHLFRRTLTDAEDQQIRDEMGIDEWTRENEEEFARMFERFMFENQDAPNEEMAQVFERYDDWLAEVYGKIQGSRIDVEPSDGVRSFFENLFQQRVQTEEGRNWMQRNIVDMFSVESRFRRIGQTRTGREIKNRESFKEMKQQEGTLLVQEVSRLLNGDEEKMTDAILAAESDQQLRSIEDEAVRDAAEKIRAYFDQAKTDYQKYGRLPVGFHERMAQEIENRREQLLQEEDPSQETLEELEELSTLLRETEDLNFVHIPTDAWFRTLAENKPEKLRRFLSLQIENERETLSINELVEDPESPITRDDLNLRDIVTSYSRQLGNDLSLLRVREAAKQEGAAVEGQDERLVTPPDEAVPFQDMSVNQPLSSWLNSMTRNRERSRFKEWINLSKMFAFWNPFFLPTYDLLQGAMVGALSPMSPVASGKSIKDGISDVMNQTEEFWKASENGVASQPFSSPIDETRKEFLRAREKGAAQASLGEGKLSEAFGALLGRLKADVEFIKNGTLTQSIAQQNADVTPQEAGKRTLLSGPFKDESSRVTRTTNQVFRTLGSMYEMSWDTAWFLDRAIRQITYRHLRDQKGLSPEEAAQTAARAHGDYASVPQSTRDTANTIFFTPTFKVAMGKFLGDSLRGAGEVITQNEQSNTRVYAGALARTAGILTAFDAIMTSALGYERDEFGRAYCRPTSATRAPKELCISWSTPFNLFTKYASRVWEAFNEPATFNGIARFFNSSRWELNPLWRIGLEIGQNQSASGGPIYNELDPPQKKMLKMGRYYAMNTIAMARQMFGEDISKEGKQAAAEELGRYQTMVMSAFSFPYIRDREAQRFQGELQRLLQAMEQEVGLKRVQRMLMQDASQEEIQEFIDSSEERRKEFFERYDDLMDKFDMRYQQGVTEPPPDTQRQEGATGVSVEDLEQ